jgi:hypothetical protein
MRNPKRIINGAILEGAKKTDQCAGLLGSLDSQPRHSGGYIRRGKRFPRIMTPTPHGALFSDSI